jgi:hypothetical protein
MYFQPIYIYVKRSLDLALENNGTLIYTFAFLTGVMDACLKFLKVDVFGLSNFLLLLVILTVLVDAYFGVKKSLKQSKEAFIESQKFEEGTFERRKNLRIHELKKFNIGKLQYTFFKCFTLLGYLFFVKHMISADTDGFVGDVLGFTSNLTLKIPVAIFWYYDFKSIGNNSAYVFGKKAPIFKIVEIILEFRIKKYLSNDKLKEL